MSDLTAIDNTGEFVFSLIHINKRVLHNLDGTLAAMSCGPDTRGNFYTQTYAYTNGAMSFMSEWIKQ